MTDNELVTYKLEPCWPQRAAPARSPPPESDPALWTVPERLQPVDVMPSTSIGGSVN
jgi:hypothetical protein